MVDVGGKEITRRAAVAEAWVRVSPPLASLIRVNAVAKGDVLTVARLAGIMAAKRTDELIPLCHSLPLDRADIRATIEADGRIHLVALASTTARTGVEMEALTAVAVAALTIIDMGKAVDQGIVIEQIRLLHKCGGRSGDYTAPGANPDDIAGVLR
jgi:cyclic pyranopterin phosphate synthase